MLLKSCLHHLRGISPCNGEINSLPQLMAVYLNHPSVWHPSSIRVDAPPRYAMLILRRESFCKATYLWPYKPVTRNLRKLMSEKMPVQVRASEFRFFCVPNRLFFVRFGNVFQGNESWHKIAWCHFGSRLQLVWFRFFDLAFWLFNVMFQHLFPIEPFLFAFGLIASSLCWMPYTRSRSRRREPSILKIPKDLLPGHLFLAEDAQAHLHLLLQAWLCSDILHLLWTTTCSTLWNHLLQFFVIIHQMSFLPQIHQPTQLYFHNMFVQTTLILRIHIHYYFIQKPNLPNRKLLQRHRILLPHRGLPSQGTSPDIPSRSLLFNLLHPRLIPNLFQQQPKLPRGPTPNPSQSLHWFPAIPTRRTPARMNMNPQHQRIRLQPRNLQLTPFRRILCYNNAELYLR